MSDIGKSDYELGYDAARKDFTVEIDHLHSRLGYCYTQMNNKLVQPIMTYEEWLGQIDKVLAR